MKRLSSFIAIILCVLMLLPVLPAVAVSDGTAIGTKAVVEKDEVPASYSYNGYKTYLQADSTLRWTVPNTTEGGTTCSAMQGMNTGTTYCYAVKRNSDDTYCDVTRINMNTGDKVVMDYYSSTSATSSSACNSFGHGNEICVVGVSGTNYMYVSTMQTGTAITRLQISGTKLMLTGYFNLVNTSGTAMSCSALAHVKTEGGYMYFLIKTGNTFYYCKISTTATGGSKSNPTDVTAYRIFYIDTRNAVFAKSNSSAGTYDVDNWTNQGVGYNPSEKVLYVPIWDSVTDNRNVVITYNLKDIDTYLTATSNSSRRLYPTKTSFVFQDTSVTSYEIESVGFRTGQGTTGDLKMYFNINCSTASKEGVYSCSYTSGSGDFTPLNEGQVLWTTKYNANGGTGSMSNTYHIKGISTKLRDNAFTRSGYTFAGWYLTRKSDGKWLYFDADGTARWYSKGSQPKTSVLALYGDQRSVSQLTGSDGDTVTCYAQWTPNATGTTSFYIQYDANGGTGTMADTKVTYGTSINTTANAFTRDGYIFTGWTAYRRNKAQWGYKDTSAWGDKWLTTADDTSAYILKTYGSGASVAKTTSVDQDIVTFYAVWSRVVNSVHPVTIPVGTDFTLSGNIETTTDLHSAAVEVKDSAGTVVASYTANPYTNGFDISTANNAINFASLAVGNYTYVVKMGTVTSSSPNWYTLLSAPFVVEDPAHLELTETATSSGIYTLGDAYFSGFGTMTSALDFKQLFKYDISIVDVNGNAVEDSGVVSTGCVISCGDESRITVLIKDLNCDALVTSADFISLAALLKGEASVPEYINLAADTDENGFVSSSDAIVLKQSLTN